MKISRDEMKHVAHLARLKLNEAEIDLYTLQMNSILEYAARLQYIDTSNIEPTTHAVQLYNVMRDDEVKVSLPQNQVLANAPEAEDGFFQVPRIV
jgi:aspartyl-tRNA(Asn)/glutamyl-tRNA(Gln) amidotransferase subunit C